MLMQTFDPRTLVVRGALLARLSVSCGGRVKFPAEGGWGREREGVLKHSQCLRH